MSRGIIQKAIATVQTGDQSGLDQGSHSGCGEKGLRSGFTVRAQVDRIPDELDVGCERKTGIEDGSSCVR